jgi:hypothetical protein
MSTALERTTEKSTTLPALIAVMTYTFARVGAVVALAVEDYFS